MSGTNHDHDYYHDDCGLCQLEKAELLERVVDRLINGAPPPEPPENVPRYSNKNIPSSTNSKSFLADMFRKKS